jgi:hydrogenase nickel incorporation protein HypA/HybF
MHELSLAIEVIELCNREALRREVTAIHEIEIEVGDLSGVDAGAFRSALEMAVQGTILEKSVLIITQIPATGYCQVCQKEFSVHQRFAPCPDCHELPVRVNGGNQFRINSLVVDKKTEKSDNLSS